MLPLSALVSFTLTALAVELSPGPNMAYLAVLSLDRGRAAGLAAVLGVACGLALLGTAVTMGLGPWILDSPAVYESLRWAGSLFLCWLAFDCWRESRAPLQDDVAPGIGLRTCFWRGCLTNLLNPKAGLFFVAVLPGFVTVQPPPPLQLGILLVLYVAVATAVHAAIVVLAGTAKPYLVRPEWRRVIGAVSALLLLAIAAWLFVASGPPAVAVTPS